MITRPAVRSPGPMCRRPVDARQTGGPPRRPRAPRACDDSHSRRAPGVTHSTSPRLRSSSGLQDGNDRFSGSYRDRTGLREAWHAQSPAALPPVRNLQDWRSTGLLDRSSDGARPNRSTVQCVVPVGVSGRLSPKPLPNRTMNRKYEALFKLWLGILGLWLSGFQVFPLSGDLLGRRTTFRGFAPVGADVQRRWPYGAVHRHLGSPVR
jgi:hypothetical protein